ncbi:uncharacterized protein C1orf232 homolog isoform X2 [Podarcis raffonei]|uniref:uncharacterized protein C1orf232 homolog isoform X2 n=1 Tax=Podarcis raffonei TaxID=65483 RepID=UPI0023296F6E|nr:uncharacterized protein C1orf232 homolog isoform X2 [Podarcis raffonei]
MTQGFWKVYKAKVLQTLGGELPEEELQDEVQGVGVKGWRSVSSLFSREDEHKLLAPEPCPDHPLAARPEEDSPSEKKTSGLWDVFATKWQQTSALEKAASKAESGDQMSEGTGASGEMAAEEDSCTSLDNDLREAEGVAFKWSFLTSKLAEIKNKSASKSN